MPSRGCGMMVPGSFAATRQTLMAQYAATSSVQGSVVGGVPVRGATVHGTSNTLSSKHVALPSQSSNTSSGYASRLFTTNSGIDKSNVFLTTQKDVEFLSKLIADQGSIDVTESDKKAWTDKVIENEVRQADKEMRHQQDGRRIERSESISTEVAAQAISPKPTTKVRRLGSNTKNM
eukprot:jgi/Hompol1/3190/HPOL_006395-RA